MYYRDKTLWEEESGLRSVYDKCKKWIMNSASLLDVKTGSRCTLPPEATRKNKTKYIKQWLLRH